MLDRQQSKDWSLFLKFLKGDTNVLLQRCFSDTIKVVEVDTYWAKSYCYDTLLLAGSFDVASICDFFHLDSDLSFFLGF